MPFINVKLAGSEPSKEQKERIIAEFTDTMVNVLGKKRERVMIFIESFDPDAVGIGGQSIENLNKESK